MYQLPYLGDNNTSLVPFLQANLKINASRILPRLHSFRMAQTPLDTSLTLLSPFSARKAPLFIIKIPFIQPTTTLETNKISP